MPRQEHVLTVFVASPSDVIDERNRLEEVIRELNVTWSRELGIRLDLVRWETHAFPGFGDDAQDVINSQIPDDYDLFLGIMWCRYGTPTKRYGSGTMEEFSRAKARYDSDPQNVQLMVYFKDEPIPPSKLDPTQLVKVNEFRKSLGEEGGLFWNFTNVDQFEKLVRIHLTRQMQVWKSQFQIRRDEKNSLLPELQDEEKLEQESQEIELGIYDLIEVLEDRFEELTKIAERIADATSDIGAKIGERTDELNRLPRDSKGNVDRKIAKVILSRVANEMNKYTDRLEAELPLFSSHLNEGINALTQAVMMASVDFIGTENYLKEVNDGLQAVTLLLTILATSYESMNEFRQTVISLPRMTSEINKAKRGVATSLGKLLTEFLRGQSLLREGEAALRSSLKNSPPDSEQVV